MGFNIYDVHSIEVDPADLGDTTVPLAMTAMASDITRDKVILGLLVANDDTVDNVLILETTFTYGSSKSRVASITIPAGCGHGGVAPLDALLGLTVTPLGLFIVPAAGNFFVGLEATPSSGKTVGISMILGLF